jgi:hypothetical protein
MNPKITWLTASWLLAAGLVSAQESLRNSLAGDAAAAAQRLQAASPNYTCKAGDFKLLMAPSLETDYNDNVTLVKTNTQQDFILKPLLQLAGRYPITQQNLLTFSVRAGYDEYLEHGQDSAPRLNSDSLLSFDMRIKDFVSHFHDRFSYFQDPSTEASVAGTAVYGGLMNAAGLSSAWDLEDLSLTLGCDHQNFVSSSGQFSYLNRSSELPLSRAAFKLRPNLTVGVEGGASFTTYDQEVLNDNQSYSAGLYADWKPDSLLHLVPRAGYVTYQFQHTSQSAQVFYFGRPALAESIETQDLNTCYADLTVSHKINDSASYALSAGHEIRPGIQADAIEDWYVRPRVTWTMVKDLGLNTSLFYERGKQGAGSVMGNLVETYDWYGGELILSYPLMKKRFMKKLLLGLHYRLTFRSSDIPSREYAQNMVGIILAYRPL